MTDPRHTLAQNISELRQEKKMTQLELAEYLNYSDKAVSKWERAESVPDIFVLLKIAELFGVTLDELVHGRAKTAQAQEKENKVPKYRHTVITALSVLLVWFVATFVFVMISIFSDGQIHGHWLAFVYAVPVSAIVWLVFNSIWFMPRMNYLIISVLMWSALASFHLTMMICGFNTAVIYLLGLVGQITIILWSMVRKRPKAGAKDCPQAEEIPDNSPNEG